MAVIKRIPWNKGLKGMQVAWNKGKKGIVKHSSEWKKQQSERLKLQWSSGKRTSLKKLSEKHKRKISISMKGKNTWMKGRRMPIKTKKALLEAVTGGNHYLFGKAMPLETREKLKSANLGKKHTINTRKKMSLSHAHGEDHWNWKGGIGSERHQLMNKQDYILWRTSVFMRDGYICVECGSKKNLQADHIKPWALYPELRYAIDNGRTLCYECHRKTDTWGYKPMYRKAGN